VLKIAYIDERIEDLEEEPPGWETVARVLQHVRQKITLSVDISPTRGSEEAFARAIRGHPTIQRFDTMCSFHFDSFGILASALASLPALESTDFKHAYLEEEEEEEEDDDDDDDLPAIEHPGHMTTLLLSPSLRSVEFDEFYFPHSLCQAVALALKTGSPITCLILNACIFSDGVGGSIVHALKRNTTLKTLRLVHNEFDESVRDALTSALIVNTSLTSLTVHDSQLHPFFVALRMNTSLKKVDVSYLSLSDELTCEALREVFAKNSILEELTLRCDSDSLVVGDTEVASWRATLPLSSGQQDAKVVYIGFQWRGREPSCHRYMD
jgi:hypothetical protein